MTDEGNLIFSALEMPEIDKQKRPHFALRCHVTPSTCTMWQHLPLLARSNFSAFTADSLDHENKMQWN